MPKTVDQHPDRWTTKTTFKRKDLDANFHIKALIILKPKPYITLGDKRARNTIGIQKWKIETDLVSSLEHHNVVSCGYICVVPEGCQCSYLLFQLWPCIKSKIVQQHQTTSDNMRDDVVVPIPLPRMASWKKSCKNHLRENKFFKNTEKFTGEIWDNRVLPTMTRARFAHCRYKKTHTREQKRVAASVKRETTQRLTTKKNKRLDHKTL
jgi:hypothetical protein